MGRNFPICNWILLPYHVFDRIEKMGFRKQSSMGFLEIKIATCILDLCVGWLIVFRNSFQMLCEVLILSKESFFDGLQQKKSLGSFDGEKKGRKKRKSLFFRSFFAFIAQWHIFKEFCSFSRHIHFFSSFVFVAQWQFFNEFVHRISKFIHYFAERFFFSSFVSLHNDSFSQNFVHFW